MKLFRTLTPRQAVVGLIGAAIWTSAGVWAVAQVPAAPKPAQNGDLPPALPAPEAGQLPPPADESGFSAIEPQLLEDARAITDPGERALALSRIARAAVFSSQLPLAHTAIVEGGEAALLVKDPLVHDQRLESIIASTLQLAEERVRAPLALLDAPLKANDKLTPARREQFRLAGEEWRFAAKLARSIDSAVTRTEASHRVVEGASFATQALFGSPDRMGGDGPARLPSIDPETRKFITNVLEGAADEAARIERPVWRDRALVSVAENAARSDEFELAIRVSRMIPQPEIRTDALLRIAENQALKNRGKEATEAYEETAKTIAMIPSEDPREVLTGVLVDSLISLGRFDDARAATVLYTDSGRRTLALAAVAESQGRRGLWASAKKWIVKEPAEIQSVLWRRLNDGMLGAMERDQGKVVPPGEFTP